MRLGACLRAQRNPLRKPLAGSCPQCQARRRPAPPVLAWALKPPLNLALGRWRKRLLALLAALPRA